MAGPVRQPIDLKALERYVDQNVPEIKTPLELKQVRDTQRTASCSFKLTLDSLDLVNRILHIKSLPQTEPNMSSGRSHPASFFPKPHIRWIVNSR